MKMKILLISVMSMLSFAVAALTAKEKSTSEEFVQEFKKYTQFQQLSAAFTQEKHLQELSTPLISKGQMSVDRKAKVIRWEIQQPAKLKVTIDSKQIEMESGEGKEKQKQVFLLDQISKDTQNWKDLSTWTDFNPDNIVQQYQVKKLGAKEFELIAKDGDKSPFKKLKIIASGTGYVSEVLIDEKSGDSLKIKFAAPKIKK